MRGAGVKAVLAAAVVAAMAAAWIAPSAAADRKSPFADAPIGTGLDDASAPKLPWPPTTAETAALPWVHSLRLFRQLDGRVALAGVRWGGLEKHAFWIAYLDAEGRTQHQTVVPLSENEFPADAIATRDGGFLLFSSIRELRLIRLNPDGRRLWSRKLEQHEISEGFYPTAVELSDGGFLIAGTAAGESRDAVRYRLTRVAADGRVIWQRSFGRRGERFIVSLVATLDDSTLILGNHDFFSVDKQGRMLWRRPTRDLVQLCPSSNGSALAIERDMGRDDWPTELRFNLVLLDHKGRVLWRRPQDLRAPHLTQLWIDTLVPAVDGGGLVFMQRAFDPPADANLMGSKSAVGSVVTRSILRYDRQGRRIWARTTVGPDEASPFQIDSQAPDATFLPNHTLLTIGHDATTWLGDGAGWWMRALPFD